MITHHLDTPAREPTPDQLAALWRDLQEMADRNVQVTLFSGTYGGYKATAANVFSDPGGLHVQVNHPASLLSAASELVRITRPRWPFRQRAMPASAARLLAPADPAQRVEWLNTG